MNRFIKKLIAGGDRCKSRFHNEKGQLAPLAASLNFPRSAISWLQLRLTGVGPKLPWLAYDAIRRVGGLLQASDRVVEYGSGMSTIWLAKRVKQLLTVESDPTWERKVRSNLRKYNCRNVACVSALDEQSYINAPLVEGAVYDVAVIDGYWRPDCFKAIVGHLTKEPLLVIDDTDKKDGGMPQLELAVLQFAAAKGLVVEKFTNFSPATLFVKETLIAYHPNRARRVGPTV